MKKKAYKTPTVKELSEAELGLRILEQFAKMANALERIATHLEDGRVTITTKNGDWISIKNDE